MRRYATLAVVALIGLVAFNLPSPPPTEEPEFVATLAPATDPDGSAAVWYCPWLSAGAVRDSWLAVASSAPVQIDVTLPSPIPNEQPDTSSQRLDGPGSVAVEVASIVRRGDAPGFVELVGGAGAVSAIVTGQDIEAAGSLVSGDRCTAAVPKLWHLPGATTRVGRTATLRLFNPFPEAAKVTVAGTSEFGDAGLLGLSAVDVAGRTWIDIDLNELTPFLDDLALTISSDEGLVIPTMVVSSGTDEASWPATGLSTSWEFPAVTASGLAPFLIVTNPGDTAVSVDIDVHTRSGLEQAAVTKSIEPGTPVRIPLADLADQAFGIAVRSATPIAAVVVAEDVAEPSADEESEADQGPQRIAGTVGADVKSDRWLVAGPNSIRNVTSTIWVLNTGSDMVSAMIVPLGSDSGEVDELELEAGTMRRIVVRRIAGVSGYAVEATGPVTVAWSAELDDAVALLSAVPVGQ